MTETATFDFSTNSYGQTVYDNNNSGYPANGTTFKQDEVTLTINPGGKGSGCRFWSTDSDQTFRIMKNSDISLSVENGKKNYKGKFNWWQFNTYKRFKSSKYMEWIS